MYFLGIDSHVTTASSLQKHTKFFRFYAHNIEQENRNKINKYKCTVTHVAIINPTAVNTAVHIKFIMIFNSFCINFLLNVPTEMCSYLIVGNFNKTTHGI